MSIDSLGHQRRGTGGAGIKQPRNSPEVLKRGNRYPSAENSKWVLGFCSRPCETSYGLLESVIKWQLLCQNSRSRSVDMAFKSPPTCYKRSHPVRSDWKIPNIFPQVYNCIDSRRQPKQAGPATARRSTITCGSQRFGAKVSVNINRWKVWVFFKKKKTGKV